VLAVSVKGMTRAFRNLTNRMEETIGECTNLHITYPAMVFGYLFVIRANRRVTAAATELLPESVPAGVQLAANDIAIHEGGEPVETIIRFHAALRELTGRRGVRDDVSRYEAVGLAMVVPSGERAGDIVPEFPPPDSPLRIEEFFQSLYLRYEERYVFGAPELQTITRRLEWAPESPAFDPAITHPDNVPELDFEVRLRGEAGV
jgi:hypothetical protein